jgi:hypothetical protein
MENQVNYAGLLPGACATGDGDAANELGEATHFYPPML